MPTLRNEMVIEASASDVWRVLGNLDSPPEWVPGVTEATTSGDMRVCRTLEGEEIHERIHGYDDARRTWSYEQTRVPLPITGSSGTLTVHDHGETARVEWEARFDVAAGADPAQLVPMVDGYYRQTLELLRQRVERETEASAGP
jgi:hypothetical protein